MYTLVLVLHTIVVILLLAVILLQRGRSGGLVESLGGIESLFGTKTSSFMVKTTIVLAILFFITSISLTVISKLESTIKLSKDIIEEKGEKKIGNLDNVPSNLTTTDTTTTIVGNQTENTTINTTTNTTTQNPQSLPQK